MAITKVEKTMVMGEIMRLAVEVSFKTHVYSFKGSFFKQEDGGTIGLRSTCAIARVAMSRRNVQWRQRMGGEGDNYY